VQDCRDTFLQYLADNVQGVTIHALRQDISDPAKALLQMNALNVQFLNSSFSITVSKQFVALDVCADDDRTALFNATQVVNILQLTGSIPKNHYALVSGVKVATPTGGFLYWNPNALNFKNVETGGAYVRLNCLLALQHNLSNL
jgi:hypothetical protein